MKESEAMTATNADARTGRIKLRRKPEEPRHADALKALLDECAFWTALWTGFPLALRSEIEQASPGGNFEELRNLACRSTQRSGANRARALSAS